MSDVRVIPEPDGGRVETGPVQFGDDWPGVFIRGDNANYFALMLQDALDGRFLADGTGGAVDEIRTDTLRRLADLLASCFAGATP